MEIEFITDSASKTIELGRKIGQQLKGGEIIGLTGNLGAGKTHLVKGLASGVGAENAEKGVNSPTFVLVNEYLGQLDIYHIDAYRLNCQAEFETIGFDDFCYPGSVVVIEWADKVESALLGMDIISIKLSHQGGDKRKIHIENMPAYMAL